MVRITQAIVITPPCLGVTKVRPLVQDPEGHEETQSSGSSSRVSSAKSLVSSMFSGSEEEEVEYDAYAKARKINLYGQVRPVRPLVTGSPTQLLQHSRLDFLAFSFSS